MFVCFSRSIIANDTTTASTSAINVLPVDTININENVQNFIGVWLDNSSVERKTDVSNYNNEDYLKTQASLDLVFTYLKSYIDPFKFFFDIDSASIAGKIFLVVSHLEDEHVISLVHSRSEIEFIYVYHPQNSIAEKKKDDGWIQKYPKIRGGVFMTRDNLCAQIKADIDEYSSDEQIELNTVQEDKSYESTTTTNRTTITSTSSSSKYTLPPMAIFTSDTKENVIHNLNKESASFIWFQLLAEILLRMSHSDEAKEDMLNECLSHTLLTLGDFLREAGEYKKAENYYRRLLVEFPQKTDEMRGIIYNNLGLVRLEGGDPDVALEYFENAENILKPLNSDLPLAATYGNKQMAYCHKGNYHAAFQNHEKTREIILKSLPANDPSMIKIHINTGVTYHKKGNYDEAQRNYQKALDLQLKAEKYPPDLSAIYNNMGGLYYSKGDYENALKYFNMAHETVVDFLPQTHSWLLDYRRNIAAAVNHDRSTPKKLKRQ
ncbi:unnamed protein product [Didymodactylos carnosus]|uniref:Uncharacterized protein n=1 Tax=Didymodactylos carnosus TaxID=1234261 RepID=A0A815RVL7_9BILA|nr:unnamed protein product [Didymodactylos carnosus]CAF1481880.1 unnamed protein product [Didymodactylos carnosus]CAF4218678.1 unnamed protein product [Didymodactylos carnosus]CAF4346747.1 unnamed protein product [Didymodactylos carnosus]